MRAGPAQVETSNRAVVAADSWEGPPPEYLAGRQLAVKDLAAGHSILSLEISGQEDFARKD